MRDKNETPSQQAPEDMTAPAVTSEQDRHPTPSPSPDTDSTTTLGPREKTPSGDDPESKDMLDQRWLFVLRHSMGLSLVSGALLVNPFAALSTGTPHRSSYMIGYLLLIGLRDVVAGWRGYDVVTGRRKPSGLGFVCRTYATETGMAIDIGLTIVLAIATCQAIVADGMLTAAMLVGAACVLMACSDFATHRVVRLACEREWEKARQQEEERKRRNRKRY